MAMWNLWHGCHRVSEGCKNCYVFRRDAENGIDTENIRKTESFNLPIRRDRKGNYKIPARTTVFTCFTSDFFLAEADQWRDAAWNIIRARADLHFFIVTKRPERIPVCLPTDWGEGWNNVTICCTMENQRQADLRLPIFRTLPIRHKQIICEPLLGNITFTDDIAGWIEEVTVGGESGPNARLCDYDWVLSIRQQCANQGVAFHFKQTGANFHKDGRTYKIKRAFQHTQAQRANIDLP